MDHQVEQVATALDRLMENLTNTTRLVTLGTALNAYYAVAAARVAANGDEDTTETILDRFALKMLTGIYEIAEVEPPG